MTNFETKPRQRVDSVAAKAKKALPKLTDDVSADPQAGDKEKEELPPMELTRSRTSIIKDIGGPEDQKKLLGLVLLLIVAFLIKKYFDL